MNQAIEKLLQLLDLEPIEVNIFRGRSPQDTWQRVFGGQVLGQALVAAARTVDKRNTHSLHAYFLRPGDPKVPILYEVERARDGKSFTTRRVVAIQHGRPIFTMSASFHIEEEGFEHQATMPDVPQPEELLAKAELLASFEGDFPPEMVRWFRREGPIDLRPVNPRAPLKPEKREPAQHVWVRATGSLPDDIAIHQCVLAYASDMTLLDTSLLPHGLGFLDQRAQLASLDHAMWFHRPFRADEWLLYTQDSPASYGSRAFSRGTIFTRDGTLVASVTQEGLVRIKK